MRSEAAKPNPDFSVTQNWLLPLAFILYAAYSARELLLAWRHSPLDEFGYIPFFLWLSPVLFLWRAQDSPDTPLLLAGLLFSLAGQIGSLNALSYFGLALSIAALLPPSLLKIPWIASAVGWMPLFGYFGSSYYPEGLVWARTGVAIAGVLVFAWGMMLLTHQPSRAAE